jgi:RNA polymerase sigma-70 factor (ECF subfamily)
MKLIWMKLPVFMRPSEMKQGQEIADAELVARLCQRDPDALSAIYDRYAHAAYGLVLRITHDHGVTEDLLQELFIRLWNRANEFNASRGALGVWILSIARNLAIDHVRSAQARFAQRMAPVEQLDHYRAPSAETGQESVIDRTRAVRTALSSLNANEKQVLELAYFEGCSHTEIATRLGAPLGTVKSWMRAALSRIRNSAKEGGRQ